jgi:hypothetical protein
MAVVREDSKYNLDIVRVSAGQMGQRWHQTSTPIYIILWKRE